jgi:hypothetical protein
MILNSFQHLIDQFIINILLLIDIFKPKQILICNNIAVLKFISLHKVPVIVKKVLTCQFRDIRFKIYFNFFIALVF